MAIGYAIAKTGPQSSEIFCLTKWKSPANIDHFTYTGASQMAATQAMKVPIKIKIPPTQKTKDITKRINLKYVSFLAD